MLKEITLPFHTITLDHAGPLPESDEGFCYLLLIEDQSTRWVDAYCVSTITMKETFDVMLKEHVPPVYRTK